MGIRRACGVGGKSEHKEGRALDYPFNAGNSTQLAQATELLNWLFATDQYGNTHALARRLGIMYIIWNKRIWRAYEPSAGWQPYTDGDPHTDHIHFSCSGRVHACRPPGGGSPHRGGRERERRPVRRPARGRPRQT